MTLTRLNPRPRISEAVTAGQTVYLAGQIPHCLTADITVQTPVGLARAGMRVERIAIAHLMGIDCKTLV